MRKIMTGIKNFLIIMVLILLASNGLGFAVGLKQARKDRCKKPYLRIDYVFPGFQLGCYMGDYPKDSISTMSEVK